LGNWEVQSGGGMKRQSLEQIAPEADVHRGIDMSRRERLERWAQPLERQPNRRISTIGGTEFGSPPRPRGKSTLKFLRSP